MDFEQAKQAFELYLNGYDRKDEKVYLLKLPTPIRCD